MPQIQPKKFCLLTSDKKYAEMKDIEKNKGELKAWIQWKGVCSIMKCNEPLREILKEKVPNAFRYNPR